MIVKIAEVEDVLVGLDAAAADRVYEVHPELSFRLLASDTMLASKKTWNGVSARRALLEGAGIRLSDELGDAGLAAADDVLDAAVAAWSAMRIADGNAVAFPAEPTQRWAGRPIRIWA